VKLDKSINCILFSNALNLALWSPAHLVSLVLGACSIGIRANSRQETY
jgi:hypothetical protein